jgi:hypothetical protein
MNNSEYSEYMFFMAFIQKFIRDNGEPIEWKSKTKQGKEIDNALYYNLKLSKNGGKDNGIYKFRLTINGKKLGVYIGKATNFINRWCKHKSQAKKIYTKCIEGEEDLPIKNSCLVDTVLAYIVMLHFSPDACINLSCIKVTILVFCSLEDINDRVRYWIDYYDSRNRKKGFNMK